MALHASASGIMTRDSGNGLSFSMILSFLLAEAKGAAKLAEKWQNQVHEAIAISLCRWFLTP